MFVQVTRCIINAGGPLFLQYNINTLPPGSSRKYLGCMIMTIYDVWLYQYPLPWAPLRLRLMIPRPPCHSVIVDLGNGILWKICSHMSDTSNQIDPRSHKYIGKRWKGTAGDYIDRITPFISNCA